MTKTKRYFTPDWSWAVATFVAFTILTGGISQPAPSVVGIQAFISVVFTVAAIGRIARRGFSTKLAKMGIGLIIVAILVVVAQLLPMPVSMWSELPDRNVALRNFTLEGISPTWMPLSLSPEGTRLAAIALLPGIACFVSALTVTPRKLFLVSFAILGCAVVSVLMAVMQHAQGVGSIFYLYESGDGIGTGTFNNQNFYAAQLYTALPILGLSANKLGKYLRINAWVVSAFATAFAALLVIGLAISESRSGIIFAMPAILIAIFLARETGEKSGKTTSAFGLVALLLGLFVVGQVSMVGLLRLTSTDPLSEYRTVIAQQSVGLLERHFLLGSGFGTFVPLYQLHETPATMLSKYVNHAHNDWLELAIEGGVPAIFLEFLFLVWFLVSSVRVWRYGQGEKTALFQRAATLIIPLLLIHSLIDFPLRTPALLGLFGFLCGMLCLPPDIPAAVPRDRSVSRIKRGQATEFSGFISEETARTT